MSDDGYTFKWRSWTITRHPPTARIDMADLPTEHVVMRAGHKWLCKLGEEKATCTECGESRLKGAVLGGFPGGRCAGKPAVNEEQAPKRRKKAAVSE